MSQAKGKRLTLYADGVSRGNPGPAAIGVVIQDQAGRMVSTLARGIGRATNNQAEYLALIAGLETVAGLGASHVDIKMDSELVVRQLRGEYRLRAAGLKPYYRKAIELLRSLDSFTIAHVPRAQNREADRLANAALDAV